MADQYVRFHARRRPLDAAVVTLAGEITYRRFDEDIDRVAAALEEAGVAPGQVVLVRLADLYAHWLMLLALSRLAITSASFGPGQSSEAPALIDPDHAIVDIAPGTLGLPSRTGIVPASAEWVREVLQRPVAAPRARTARDPAGPGRIALSSGATGRPKKIERSWQDLEAQASRITGLTGSTGVLNRLLPMIGPESGSWATCCAVWVLGAATLIASPRPAELALALPRLRPTMLVLAPVQLRLLLENLPQGFTPVPGLQVGVAGSHTPPELQRETRLRLTSEVMNVYASTETGFVASAHLAQLADASAAGWVQPWAEVEIVDDEGRPLAAGGLGAIRVRGPEVADGYMDDAEATARFFRDGWFYPGDIGSLSEDGFLRVHGRTDEVMNLGGEKFLPMTLENPVLGLEGVREAAAFHLEDDKGFPVPWMAIVRGEGLDEQALSRALAIPGLPPVHIVWVEQIPRNALGKPQRDMLRKAASTLPKAKAPQA